MKLTSSQIQLKVKSQEPVLRRDKVWTHISTDSRVLSNGALFVALAGENFDGHNYIQQALIQGCHGILVHKDVSEILTEEQKQKVQVFKVEDTLVALQELALYQSQNLASCLKIAITGTSGKTTTKYFAHQILEDLTPHYFSPKSFNNHIGVPLSVLEIDEKDKLALLEVGMNQPGEIRNLIQIIEPDVTLVTMAGRGHLEGLGTQEDVLKEKMSMYSKGKAHIINMDDPKIVAHYNEHYYSEEITRVYVSSQNPEADVYLKVVSDQFDSFKVQGHIGGVQSEALIPISGSHHITNVLMAAAIALHSELSVKQIWGRLSCLKPFWGRSEILKTKKGLNIYFDAYNANPDSMKAFFNQISKLETPPFIVLGEMGELGESTPAFHYELGALAAQVPHQKVWFMGPSFKEFERGYSSVKNEKNLVVSDSYKEDIALKYQSMLKTGNWIALKGSRRMRLETFLSLFEGVELH